MPRQHHPAPSTVRNRNRITNKSRLRIHHGDVAADAIIPDEGDEKNRLLQSVAGVDQEDAREHHLQAVLEAAQLSSTTRSSRKEKETPTVYIPTPDSTGVADNYAQLYPPGKWRDPVSYLFTSNTVEDCCLAGLADGFTYYMDERDKEWLDRNNEEARGEGTSVQGAMSGTRTSARSAKAKGKEPEGEPPMLISDNEFELVMGIFELATHEKTEYLHHSLETGMAFPSYSEYQDTFNNPLAPSTFANFGIPPGLPPPPHMARLSRVIYPYWRDRRIERGGHRIIPALLYDENDTLNESYICFRRREVKAVRKTRASQVTSSDKLARLQEELAHPLQMAQMILAREKLKRESSKASQILWDRRAQMVELKRKNPLIGEKGDEELLIDRERLVRRELRNGLKIPIKLEQTSRPEVAAKRPSERLATLQAELEKALQRQKVIDHQWDDYIDYPIQTPSAQFASRLFRSIPQSDTSIPSKSEDPTEGGQETRQGRSVRLRVGRGGRLLVDRRPLSSPSIPSRRRSSEMSQDEEETEERLAKRWKFDADDDVPPIGSQGADEQERVLVDDYDLRYLRHTTHLIDDDGFRHLTTDPSLTRTLPDGRRELFAPYKLGYPVMRIPPHQQRVMSMAGMKMMPQQQMMRISSNGGMRPQVTQQSMGPSVGTSLQPPMASLFQPPSAASNGNGRAAISLPNLESPKVDGTALTNSTTETTVGPQPQGVAGSPTREPAQQPLQRSPDVNQPATLGNPLPYIPRPKSQADISGNMLNGYHINGFPPQQHPAVNISNATFIPHPTNVQNSGGLSIQQVQNLKNAFAVPTSTDGMQSTNGRTVVPYIHNVPSNAGLNLQMGVGATMNLKLPPSRSVQWVNGQARVNGMGLEGLGSSPNMGPTIPLPTRTPSANGIRLMSNNMHNGLSMSPPYNTMQMSPPPIAASLSQSPQRMTHTPTLGMSPPLQHAQPQPVVGPQGGY